MIKLTWKHGLYCISAWLGSDDDTIDPFTKSSFGNISPLLWRIPIFLWSIIVLSVSVNHFWGPTEQFLIYMTHWGLVFIVMESLFGIIVALRKRRKGTDATFGLPWYVKTYWVLYNISIPVAFLITVFYWGILRISIGTVKYSPNPILDVMIHAVNSVVMLIELICSAHPSRLLHIMQPLYFAGAYMVFSITYYFAGGLDPWGHKYVYPVIDWSKPQQTMVVITMTALFLALMHLIVVAVATARDVISRRCKPDPTGVYNDGFEP